MRKGMSAVLLIVVSATVLILLAMIMFYMNQAPVDWMNQFQADSEKCEMRGGECVDRKNCEGQVVSGECSETTKEHTTYGTKQGTLGEDVVCCFSPGG